MSVSHPSLGTSAEDCAIRRLVAAEGVQTGYTDMAGQRQSTPPEVLRNIIDCLGPKTFPGTIEPVYVAWNGRVGRIKPSAPASQCFLKTESGDIHDLKPGAIEVPRLPFGYHILSIDGTESLIISAPSKSYSDPDQPRGWGVFVPMYALHSRRGASDFRTWREFIDWLHPLGASVVGTLPLLAAFLDGRVCEPSPYSPASRLFWNEFYLGAPGPTSAGGLIDYAKTARVRRQLLQRESQRFFQKQNTPRFREFQTFLRQHPHLEQYSRFRAACEATRKAWHSWPERMRAGKLRPSDYREADKNYHAYAQWRAQEEMDRLLEHCRARRMKFYLDLPVGVHPDSYDVWRERDSFALEASVGAPPDPTFTRGQDWGFPPLHPHRLRETKYRYFIDYIRFQMRHTGLLRIDHVMGLHRLYWIPKGRPAAEGAYVSYRAEELYAILCLESHRNKTILVGENLGTVPPEVNAAMGRRHLCQIYAVQYELPKLRPPPHQSVASLNTHDMPPFAAFLRSDDIHDRHKLGLIPNSKLKGELQGRRRLVSALAKSLNSGSSPRALLHAVLRWLARGPAEIALINLEDLWLETLPQNIPGTCAQRPNWRRQTRLSLEQIRADRTIQKLLRLIAKQRSRISS